MPTVNPLPPPPMRHKWGKHCPPICPPGLEDDAEIEVEVGAAAQAGNTDSNEAPLLIGDIDHTNEEIHAHDTSDENSLNEDELKEEDEDDHDHDHTHRDSSWPPDCHPPFCFLAVPDRIGEAETYTEPDVANVADLDDSVPRGGLVRGEARVGSVELNL